MDAIVEPTPPTWQGEYTDGLTAQVTPVTIRVTPTAVSFADVATGAVLGEWRSAELQLDERFAGLLQLCSSAAPGAALMVSDLAFRAALSGVIPGLPKRRYGRGTLALALVVVVAAAAAGLWTVLTPASEVIARKIPFTWERKLSTQMRTYLSKTFCHDPEAEAMLRRMRDRLLAGTRYPVVFDVRIINDPAVNAFAMPGGLIVVNRGLLAKAESPDEVAGVLAHEMQHVIQRHVTAGIVRGAILTSAWQITVGDFSGLLVVDPSSAYNMATLSFSRRTETEADEGAAKMLDGSGVARDGIVKFFERLRKIDSKLPIPALLSTHPPTGDRIALFLAKTAGIQTTPSLSKHDWLTLKNACNPVSDDDDDDDEEAE